MWEGRYLRQEGEAQPVSIFQSLCSLSYQCKGEKERYTHLNAEFQRIVRRDKKAFLSDQCKEIKENNRIGKTRDLFKKIRDTKGTFHAKMGLIMDRNGMDLTESEDIKKRWQEYTELYKKDLQDPDNHDGMITHLKPDILECEVKWALESITTNKASGSDGIPVELFQILKDDAVKVLHSICKQIWKTQQWPQDWKRSVSGATLGITDKMEARPQPLLLILQAWTWDEGVRPCNSDLFFFSPWLS